MREIRIYLVKETNNVSVKLMQFYYYCIKYYVLCNLTIFSQLVLRKQCVRLLDLVKKYINVKTCLAFYIYTKYFQGYAISKITLKYVFRLRVWVVIYFVKNILVMSCSVVVYVIVCL